MIGLTPMCWCGISRRTPPQQSPSATTFIAILTGENPGFITTVALIELVWVMQGCYDADRQEIVSILDTLLRTREMVVENAETAILALNVLPGQTPIFRIACWSVQPARLAVNIPSRLTARRQKLPGCALWIKVLRVSELLAQLRGTPVLEANKQPL